MQGTEEGDACDRNGCDGVISLEKSENCSCHISPPCSSCTSACLYCDSCGWHEDDDPKPEQKQQTQAQKDQWDAWSQEQDRLRNLPLDNTKVSWRSKPHSSCSMVKEGVYPQTVDVAADRALVLKEVKGTFGGRFDHFGDGRFRYVAYTD